MNQLRIWGVLGILGICLPNWAGDWSQWRGPNRNGEATDFRLPAVLPEELKLLWAIDTGEGHSSPIVYKGNIYLHHRVGNSEVLSCFDSRNGAVLWQSEPVAVAYEKHPSALAHGKGPRSTPAASGGRIYSFGITGILSAHRAKDGKLLWRRDFQEQFERTDPAFGATISPLIWNGLCFIHLGNDNEGALTALHAKTGETAWQWTQDSPAYGSPSIITLNGTQQLLSHSRNTINGHHPKKGTLLWRIPLTSGGLNSVSPLAVGDKVISSVFRVGTQAHRVFQKDGKWKSELVWQDTNTNFYMSTPVVKDNFLYGLSNRRKGQFVCMSLEDGEILWQNRGRCGENASLTRTANNILALSTNGNLYVFPTGSQTFQLSKTYRLAETQTWAHPAYFENKIAVKSLDRLALWSFE